MREFVRDRAREQGNVPQILFLSLLQHAMTCAIDFVQNAYKMTPLLPQVLKIEQYQEFWRLLGECSNTIYFLIPPELFLSV